MKPETSLARIKSNRRNARKSTGPKTKRGKDIVKWNALKHGLLSREVVIPTGDGKESRSDFESLLEALSQELNPVGVLEEMLVEKITVCYWRLRRVLCCETGELRKGLDTLAFDEAVARHEEVDRLLDSWFGGSLEKQLVRTSAGVERLLRAVEGIRHDVEEHGELCDDAKTDLAKYFGSQYRGFGCTVSFWCWVLEDGPEKSPDEFTNYGELPPKDECKRIVLELLDDKKEQLENALEIVREHEEFRYQSRRASLYLPSAEEADRILRYETTIERQLYRALNQLDRLQRERKGDAVPPPINVELSGNE